MPNEESNTFAYVLIVHVPLEDLYISWTFLSSSPDSKVPPNKIVCCKLSDNVTTANFGCTITYGKVIDKVADDIAPSLLIVKQYIVVA